MDIDNLLYDLTDEYEDLEGHYFSGCTNNEFIRVHRALMNNINKKKNSSINAQEKRILEATIDYILALSSYCSSLALHGEYQSYPGMIEEHGKSVSSKLEYALEKLKEGKERLYPKADTISIDFLNEAISETSMELDKIKGYERSVFANKINYKLYDARLKSGMMSDIMEIIKKNIRDKIDEGGSKNYPASNTIKILLQDSRVNGDIASDLIRAESIDERKNIIEKEIEKRKAVCERDKIMLNIFNKSRWVAIACFFLAISTNSLLFFLLSLILAGINHLYSESIDPQDSAYKPGEQFYKTPEKMGIFMAIYIFSLGVIFSPLLVFYLFDEHGYRKEDICSKYHIKYLKELLNNASFLNSDK